MGGISARLGVSWLSVFVGPMAAVATLPAPLHAQLEAQGAEFQVNQYTTEAQLAPSMAADADGTFVVTWISDGQDGGGGGIFARRHDSSGAPIGDEFRVNSYTIGSQQFPIVAVGPAGNFLFAWDGAFGQDGDRFGLFAQRFDSAGSPLGAEFQVNTHTAGSQGNAKVAAGPAGDFVLAWYNSEYLGAGADVLARRYDGNGVAQGAEFLVNSYTIGEQSFGDIAAGGGGFVVVWSTPNLDGHATAIAARRFDGALMPLGAEFLVNTYTTSAQLGARTAAGPSGEFVVVWTSENQDGNSAGVFGQLFDSAGTRRGSEFQVNTYTHGTQNGAVAAFSPAGDFVVTWEQSPILSSQYDVFARAFDANGVPGSDEFQLNVFTTGSQTNPHVVAVGPLRYVVAWTSYPQDGSSSAIIGRRFAPDGAPVTGRKLILRTPASGTSKNKLVFVSTDSTLTTPEDAVEDPRCPPLGSGSVASGARLRVVGAGGDFTIDLPCVNWSADSNRRTYRYRDGTGATCSVVRIKAGRLLKAVCEGPQVAYTLGGPQPAVHVNLAIGDPASERKYCASIGSLTAATVMQDGSNGRIYKALNAGPGGCP